METQQLILIILPIFMGICGLIITLVSGWGVYRRIKDLQEFNDNWLWVMGAGAELSWVTALIALLFLGNMRVATRKWGLEKKKRTRLLWIMYLKTLGGLVISRIILTLFLGFLAQVGQ